MKPQLLISLLSLLYSFTVFSNPKTTQELEASIRAKGYNGVVLVMKGNKVLLNKAYGFSDLVLKTPLQVTDRFQIGSLTKQMVAAALLKLEDEGRISLDDFASKYLPQYSQLNNVTILQLLNHTAGIYNYSANKTFMDSRSPNKFFSLDEIINFCLKRPLDFRPGTKWSYSNGGYIIAGKIIELASGMSWDKYLESRFFIPLKMAQTLHYNDYDQLGAVNGYQHTSNALKRVRGLNLSWALSAGSISSTVNDLAKWTDIFSSSNILSRRSKSKMQKVYKEQYGLGIFITSYGQDTLINHRGITRGFKSSLFYLKNKKLKIITLDNIDGSVEGIPEMLLQFYGR
jgi:CubicO group peptidase (beta-lactamase class C family)